MKHLIVTILVLSAFGLRGQKLEVLQGSTENVKNIKAFELEMLFEDIQVKDNGTEEDLKEKVLDKLNQESEETGQDWLEDWEKNKNKKYPSKYSRGYNKTLAKVGQIIATRSFEGETDGRMVVETQIIGLGFQKGRKVEEATLTAVIYFYNDSDDLLLKIKMTDIPGKQNSNTVWSDTTPWYATFERISEAYARMGRDLAIYIYEAEFK